MLVNKRWWEDCGAGQSVRKIMIVNKRWWEACGAGQSVRKIMIVKFPLTQIPETFRPFF